MIEKLGLMEFNRKSEEMKIICDGRFKRFKKSFDVHSLSELRATVSDADLLWVLEYWARYKRLHTHAVFKDRLDAS